MNILQKILKIGIIIYCLFGFLILILSFFSIEPKDEYQFLISSIIRLGIPLIILLSLFFTVNKKISVWMNIQFIIITPVVAFCALFMVEMLSLFFSHHWVNNSILFENKKDKTQSINEQFLVNEELGNQGTRMVKIIPFFGVFQKVVEIDTAQIDKNEWLYLGGNNELKLKR
jgi:hypothetical protein